MTTLTLPPEATNLIALSLQDNPLDTLVLPEPLASSTNILSYIEELQTDGVRIYGYPLAINLAATTPSLGGSFGFHLAGPPGAYRVNVSTDFSTWTNLDWVTNTLGSAEFIDLTAGQRTHSFYRVNLEPY